MSGRRSKFASPWHDCIRCGKKTHLDHMIRQRGLLICTRPSCFDESLVGERDAAVAKAIMEISLGSNQEMNPDPRLAEQAASTDEDIIF